MSEKDSYPPFVSPRSPSYERARRERQHPTSTGHPQVIALLARLSEAEQNAVQAYSTVVPTLKDLSFASVVRDRLALHQARREALGKLIEALGGSAPRPEECREILTQALDTVAQARTDSAAKRALNAMRDELSEEYQVAMQSQDLSAEQRDALAFLAPAPNYPA